MCEINKYKERIQKHLDSLTDEEFVGMFTNAGFEVIEGTGEIIFTEKCIECESVFKIDESDSSQSSSFCSLKCENDFRNRMSEPIEFI